MSDATPKSLPITNRTIGLVLIGLFAGILLTLWLGGLPWMGDRPVEVSRTVQLGSEGNGGAVPAPPTEGPLQYLDVMSMNAVFKAVSQSVTPTVVYIEVESLPGSNLLSPFSQRGGVSQSLGSGVILSDDGYIVTNNHVIEGATRIRVTLNDKREYPAQVIGADPTTDLAVIKIDSNNDIPVVALGDADKVEVGEWVLAVGNPFRLTSTVTAGIVSVTGCNVNVIEN